MALTVRHVGEAQPRPERTRDRELELQRQRRTGARSIFASRIVGSPAPVTPNRSTVFASGCVSTWIRKRTVKQHPCSLFFTFSPLSVFLLSRLLWCRYWCEPEERFFCWAARDGGARRENTAFTLMWEDYLLPTRGAEMKGECCSLTAAAVKATAPWPGREEEWAPPPTAARAPSQRWHRNSSSGQREPPDSVPWWVRDLCTKHSNFARRPLSQLCCAPLAFFLSLKKNVFLTLTSSAQSPGRSSACVPLVLLGHLGFTVGMQRVCG